MPICVLQDDLVVVVFSPNGENRHALFELYKRGKETGC